MYALMTAISAFFVYGSISLASGLGGTPTPAWVEYLLMGLFGLLLALSVAVDVGIFDALKTAAKLRQERRELAMLAKDEELGRPVRVLRGACKDAMSRLTALHDRNAVFLRLTAALGDLHGQSANFSRRKAQTLATIVNGLNDTLKDVAAGTLTLSDDAIRSLVIVADALQSEAATVGDNASQAANISLSALADFARQRTT